MSTKPKKTRTKFVWDLSAVAAPICWNRLRTIRKQNGLSLLEVAAGSKTSITTIFFLEGGADSRVGLEIKKRIADYFGLRIGQLFPTEMVGRLTAQEFIKAKLEADQKAGASHGPAES